MVDFAGHANNTLVIIVVNFGAHDAFDLDLISHLSGATPAGAHSAGADADADAAQHVREKDPTVVRPARSDHNVVAAGTLQSCKMWQLTGDPGSNQIFINNHTLDWDGQIPFPVATFAPHQCDLAHVLAPPASVTFVQITLA